MNAPKTYQHKIQIACGWVLFLLFLFTSIPKLSAQVSSKIDSLSTLIGGQLQYQVMVEVDSAAVVVFPERIAFIPFEVVSESAIDSVFRKGNMQLTKQYALTQFDSGRYTVPKQKVLVNKRAFYTDSFDIFVRGVMVDTTKQKMFDIKPIITIEKPSNWRLLYWFIGFIALGLVAYWFFEGKPSLTKNNIALLPPYEEAMEALKKLDGPAYIKAVGLKTYYSELTFILRQYLNQKVLDNALESTTEEIMFKLRVLGEAKKLVLDKKTLANFESILQRADLVKFAKSKPDFQLAQTDKNTIAAEIKLIKEKLPDPNAEGRLNDPVYLATIVKEKKNKKRRKLVLLTIGFLLLIFSGLFLKYGATYVIDTVTRNPSKILLESDPWVTSEYGAPGIILSTPKVLERYTVTYDTASATKT